MSLLFVPLVLNGALWLWLFITALRTGRAHGLAFADFDTREKQPLIFWSYTVIIGAFFVGSLCVLVDLLLSW